MNCEARLLAELRLLAENVKFKQTQEYKEPLCSILALQTGNSGMEKILFIYIASFPLNHYFVCVSV